MKCDKPPIGSVAECTFPEPLTYEHIKSKGFRFVIKFNSVYLISAEGIEFRITDMDSDGVVYGYFVHPRLLLVPGYEPNFDQQYEMLKYRKAEGVD